MFCDYPNILKKNDSKIHSKIHEKVKKLGTKESFLALQKIFQTKFFYLKENLYENFDKTGYFLRFLKTDLAVRGQKNLATLISNALLRLVKFSVQLSCNTIFYPALPTLRI